MSKTQCITISIPTEIATAAKESAARSHKKTSEWFRDAAIQFLAVCQNSKKRTK